MDRYPGGYNTAARARAAAIGRTDQLVRKESFGCPEELGASRSSGGEFGRGARPARTLLERWDELAQTLREMQRARGAEAGRVALGDARLQRAGQQRSVASG